MNATNPGFWVVNQIETFRKGQDIRWLDLLEFANISAYFLALTVDHGS